MAAGSQRDFALEIIERLRADGHQALLAGGCVRDELLGLTPSDYDVATSAPPEAVRALFGRRRTLAIGVAFGVVSVLGGRGRSPIEVATFRSDGQYRDGRRPTQVTFSSAEADAERRDFTINGMFYDPAADEVIDYVGGRRDLEAGVIRAIGDPRQRIAEDKLRMLRAVRFACRFDYALDPATLEAICHAASQVAVVSAERIGAELGRILQNSGRRRGVELLIETGLAKVILPELVDLEEQDPGRLTTTLERLDELREPSLSLSLAALLLDAAECREIGKIARRFRFANKVGDHAAWLAKSLDLTSQARQVPWPKMQRVLSAEGAEELIDLAAAEWSEDHPEVAWCRTQLARPADELNPPPLVTGDDLIAAGLSPGPHFRNLLDHLRDEQLEGKLVTSEEAVKAAQHWMQQDRPKR